MNKEHATWHVGSHGEVKQIDESDLNVSGDNDMPLGRLQRRWAETTGLRRIVVPHVDPITDDAPAVLGRLAEELCGSTAQASLVG